MKSLRSVLWIAIIVVAVFSLAPAPAFACVDEDGKRIPCNQDPGGGGGSPGGMVCANPTGCWECGEEQQGGFRPCVQVGGDSACSCNYPGGICAEHGSCTYTG